MHAAFTMVENEHVGMRLDHFLVQRAPQVPETEGWSRSGIQRLIAGGQITVNGRRVKPSTLLKLHDRVEVQGRFPEETGLAPEALPLDILYEDEDCLVVNKAPGIVVHPAAGTRGGTLVHALLHHCPNLPGIAGEKRPGIVHRLDKDTSGAIVVAKHGRALCQLAQQFKERKVKKEYLALVWGRPEKKAGLIDRPIGRHARDRKRMSSTHSLPRWREARTEWRVVESFQLGPGERPGSWVTLVRLTPRTGRTHQLRVHLADQKYPVVGDRLYGRRQQGLAKKDAPLRALADFPRQALHAETLGFRHPRTGRPLEFHAPLHEDMRNLLACLREWQLRNEGSKESTRC